jgi:hypothetical protein
MNGERSQPHALALWLLRFCPKQNRESLTGDLLESFREGRSDGWFWQQVLAAIVVGALGQLKLRSTEICFAVAGTALISYFQWGQIFATAALDTLMNWGARLQWLTVIETVTALMVWLLFAAFFGRSKRFRWPDLLRVFFTCVLLFGAGDLLTIWWNVSHRSQAAWSIPAMVGWIFATLIIAARVSRQLSSTSKIVPR